MLDLHSFLLEVIRANNLGSFPFQALLRLFQELFPLVVATCLHLFEQLVEKGTYDLKRLFQKDYTTIPFPASFLTCILTHIKHA